MRVTRVTIAPFDTCFERTHHHSAAFKQLGLAEVTRSPWDDRLTADTLPAWQSSPERRLTVSASGIGLVLDRRDFDIADPSPVGIAAILAERAALHRSVHQRSNELCTLTASINDRLQQRCAGRTLAKSARADIFGGPPYVFTFYVVDQAHSNFASSEEGRRALSALLEPSQVRCWQSGDLATNNLLSYDQIAETIRTLEPSIVLNSLRDMDLQAGTSSFSTWASVVVMTSDDYEGTIAFYESIEIRLQLAWMASFLTRRWAERLFNDPKSSAESLERSALKLDPLVRLARRSLDARTSSRSQKAMDALVQSSGLGREVETAEELLAALSRRRDYELNLARRRYDNLVEVILFLLAGTQVVPLISDTPLVALPLPVVVTLLVVLLLLIVLRTRRS